MLKPLPGYCVIEPIEDDTKTSKGVYLPDTSKDKPSRGKVIAVGPRTKVADVDLGKGLNWYKFEESPVKADEIVIFKKWTNQEVKDGDKTYLLVKFDELLAIVE